MMLNVGCCRGTLQSMVKLTDATSHDAGNTVTNGNRSDSCSSWSRTDEVFSSWWKVMRDDAFQTEAGKLVSRSRCCHGKWAITESWPLSGHNGQQQGVSWMQAVTTVNCGCSLQALPRYVGAVPCRQWKASMQSRNCIHSRTRSQRRSWRSWVIWSDCCAEKISRAAAVRTDWSLWRRWPETLARDFRT